MNVTSANGIEGCLIYVHTSNEYMFRVYDKADGSFKDYTLRHCDLSIIIADEDASFYEHSDGRLILDHAPETLGIKEDGK